MRVSNEFGVRYKWASFGAPELAQRVRPPEAIEQARAAVTARLVVIAGPSGAGKTVLAAAMVKGHPGTKIVHGSGDWPRYVEDEQVEDCRTAPVLVFDALDCFHVPPEGPEDEDYLDVGALVWPRVPTGRATIITTVLTLEKLFDFFPVIAQARHDLTVIQLDPTYRFDTPIAHLL